MLPGRGASADALSSIPCGVRVSSIINIYYFISFKVKSGFNLFIDALAVHKCTLRCCVLTYVVNQVKINETFVLRTSLSLGVH